jgi:superkiller protein 3
MDIESALIFWPNELDWHKMAGELWRSLGNETKAIAHLEFVKTQAPDDIDNGLSLAKTYLSANNLPAAVNQLTELSKLEPNKYEVWESLSDAQFDSGLVNEALDSAEMAIKVNPFSVKPYLLKAQVDLDNGLIEKAYEQVKEADQRVKDDGIIKVFLAKVLNVKGEKSAALAALEEATHCQNLTPKTILEEIRLIKEINGAGSARNLIEYFTKQMPENTELLSLLAESQLDNGDSHGAEVTARRVLKLKPDSKNMLLFIGKQQLKKGQLDQAIHSFSQVVNLDSNNIEAHYRLNDAYCEQRQIAKALDTLNRIIEIDPTQTEAYLKMAVIHKDTKNYKQAEEMLKKAVELEPKNVAIKRQLGALLALNLVHQSQEVSSQL